MSLIKSSLSELLLSFYVAFIVECPLRSSDTSSHSLPTQLIASFELVVENRIGLVGLLSNRSLVNQKKSKFNQGLKLRDIILFPRDNDGFVGITYFN